MEIPFTQETRLHCNSPIPPALPPRSDKRALLLIYIHGFKGNEISFKQFPADFQEVLRARVKKYTVHTHVYPKYKTKRQFSVATVNFCEWLRNTIRSYHRPLNTIDVILFGHSMGGSLASEAIILLSRITFQHNIIGMIGLDVPFLGIHPHVVASGISGLMKSGQKAPPKKERLNRPTAETDSTSTLSLPESQSPYSSETASSSQSSVFEPLPPPRRIQSPQPTEKKSDFKKTITKTVRAIYKNRHDLGGAAPRYLWSHIEFGHILLDPIELKAQYDQLRQLPVYFANFYTCIPTKKDEGKEDGKGRVFCSLPSGVARDMAGWEEIEMPCEMDEPTAHSAIFVKEEFRGYGDMIEKIVQKVLSWESTIKSK